MFTLHRGDCLEVLRAMDADSIDACVTDPPYDLTANKNSVGGFMGKAWDGTGIAFKPETWAEVLRVLKPGAHLVAFGGTRTYHRMVCAIEDAGFEIRDQLAWVYGSGFPKSLDVSKAIDKAAGAERAAGTQYIAPDGKPRGVDKGIQGGKFAAGESDYHPEKLVTLPATEAAAQWQGWGTALKPAWEPIVLARKPLNGTVAQNVLRFGTGAINVDGCRVGSEVRYAAYTSLDPCHGNKFGEAGTAAARRGTQGEAQRYEGRWPANLLHDGSEEVLAGFPQSNGQLAKAAEGGDRCKTQNVYGAMTRGSNGAEPRADTGSAARFFYCAKASRKDRGEDNTHPTVKPTDLMRYLCKLITPPNGTVLDPFTGSGSTGLGAMLGGFDFIGIEREEEYADIADRRLAAMHRERGLDLV